MSSPDEQANPNEQAPVSESSETPFLFYFLFLRNQEGD